MIDVQNFKIKNIKLIDNIASVTSILSIMSLPEDYNKIRVFMSDEKINSIKNNAALRGTIIHDVVRKYFSNEDYDIVLNDEKLRNYMIGTQYYLNKFCKNFEPIYIEHQFISYPLRMFGTPDLVVKNNIDNNYILIDFKTSSQNILKDEILLKYKLQLVAYKYLIEDNDKNINIDDMQIVVFSGKKNHGLGGIYYVDKNEVDDLYRKFNEIKDLFYVILEKYIL